MVDLRVQNNCPACGGELSQERVTGGLCPSCLIELALESPSLMDEIESPDEAPTLRFGADQIFSEGRVHGERYRIRSLLGRGGMGEVWRAYDLKLRLDVALKSLRDELVADSQALESLRQEVRTAREVISPNVCRVFDLQELDGKELISMEYVDGTTLQEILEARGPLELNEAREIASQFLAGLEAIHEAGLVHRDIKPENLMITHTGRVVVMDFGIAKALQEGKGDLIAGTPAYMSPEQARGQELDSRSDLFSAGVVLAEMVEPEGVGSFEDRKRVWEGIHQAEARVTETPWTKVITRAAAADREVRYASAAALARSLEEVTLRATGDDDVHPYPGLAAFQKEDAEYFYGRELEVEALWKKLRRPQMLAVIGPSGAGKSSFLRAGLLSSLPDTWSVVLATPADRPFAALARVLAEVLPRDQETVDSLLRFEDPGAAISLISDWRQQHEHTLIVLDQFEELFTQNSREVQASFTELLGKLPLEANVHLLLSMRDDFLFHCQTFEPLAPIFSELTPIGAPTGAALRRAIVQPALKCGYRFEDESLVEEMLGDVEGERGSLPMVAFAAAKLWEMRDRDQGLLTREAYERIGGVGGALAQHAETALERIGTDQISIVRELFRNLVTAEGTRATRDREELLSVFEIKGGQAPLFPAEGVLNALIDARLLTSYEVSGTEDAERQSRIEIIHESLLSNWPRLVRWQIQDADSAQLRDQLRQAARTWIERGKPSDLLWSGTSYQEYQLWRKRYPGGLTSAEEHFTLEMTSHAERRHRQRRLAIAALITLLVVGLGIVGAFWYQAAQARDQAKQETLRAEQEKLRAEANQLLALGRLEIETNPTGALAYALASLERADDPVTRLFALEILSRGPTALILDQVGAPSVDFSPDGRWLVAGVGNGDLKLWSSTGGQPKLIGTNEGPIRRTRFGPDSEVVASLDWRNDVAKIWSMSDGSVIRTISPGNQMDIYLVRSLRRLLTFTEHGPETRIQGWPLDGGNPELYGEVEIGLDGWYYQNNSWGLDIDPSGARLAYIPVDTQIQDEQRGRNIELLPVEELASASPRLVGRHSEYVNRVAFHPDGEHLASGSISGEVRLWSLAGVAQKPQRVLSQPPGFVRSLAFDATGSRLAAGSGSGHMALWTLEGPPDADPMLLPLGDTGWVKDGVFHPDGEWLATASGAGVKAWPIGRRHPISLQGHEGQINDLVFLPDGESIASVSLDGTIRLWPLSAGGGVSGRVLFDIGTDQLFRIAVDPLGKQLLTGGSTGQVWLVPVKGGLPRQLKGFGSHIGATALGPSGRLAAAAGQGSQADDASIRVWDLETGENQILGAGDGQGFFELRFTPDGRLISAGNQGIRIWNLADGSFQTHSERPALFDLTPDGQFLLVGGQEENNEAVLYDLEQGTSEQLDSHGPAELVAISPDGRNAVTVGEGVQVGPVNGGATHLIVGSAQFNWPTISPDGRWIAAVDRGNTVRLWPMPDMSEPPLHTLPHDQLLIRLQALTNLRVVKDPESTTGWGWDLDPFPGWEEVPTW